MRLPKSCNIFQNLPNSLHFFNFSESVLQAFSRAAKRSDAEGEIHGGQTVRLKDLQVR